MLDVAQPSGMRFAVGNQLMPQFAGGVASLRNSKVHPSPGSFDTVSLSGVGVSEHEQQVIVDLHAAVDMRSWTWLKPTIVALAQLMRLPRDWNSDRAKQIDPRAIEKMLGLLLTVLESDTTPPAVVPTTRGGVQVEWHQNGVDLEIEAISSGELEFFFSGPEGNEEGAIKGDLNVLKPFTRCLKPART